MIDRDTGPTMPTLAELKVRLARSQADVAAGRTVPLDQVLAELDASIERMERDQVGRGGNRRLAM